MDAAEAQVIGERTRRRRERKDHSLRERDRHQHKGNREGLPHKQDAGVTMAPATVALIAAAPRRIIAGQGLRSVLGTKHKLTEDVVKGGRRRGRRHVQDAGKKVAKNRNHSQPAHHARTFATASHAVDGKGPSLGSQLRLMAWTEVPLARRRGKNESAEGRNRASRSGYFTNSSVKSSW